MDPFSIATGSIALVSTITKVGISLTGFVREVRDARSDIDGVSAELNSLKTILELIVDDVEAAKSPLPPLLKTRIEGILSSCSQAVNDIDACVKCHRGSRVQKGMRWATIGKGEMSRLQSTLEANKATLSLALDMISITTLQEVKQTTEEIQNTTTNIYQTTGDIKEDTAKILQAIVELQARLPPEENPRYNMLQRYLDELSTYAESVIDDMDRNLDVYESSSEASTPRGPSPDSSFTTFVESEQNGQITRQKALPPTNDLDIYNPIDAHPSRRQTPTKDRKSPSREFEHQSLSTPEIVQGTDITSNENASHMTQRQSPRELLSAMFSGDTQEPFENPRRKTEMERIRARAKEILQESRQQRQQQDVEKTAYSSPEDSETRIPNFSRNHQPLMDDKTFQHYKSGRKSSGEVITAAQRLEKITSVPQQTISQDQEVISPAEKLEKISGIPQPSISQDQLSYIWLPTGLKHIGLVPVPTALLDCETKIATLRARVGYEMFLHLVNYTYGKFSMLSHNKRDYDRSVVATELPMRFPGSRRSAKWLAEIDLVCSMIAVLRYLDRLPGPLLPPSYIVEPKLPRFRLTNGKSDKERIKAAHITLNSMPMFSIGILVVILRIFAQTQSTFGAQGGVLAKKVLRSNEKSHAEFLLYLLEKRSDFDDFRYIIPRGLDHRAAAAAPDHNAFKQEHAIQTNYAKTLSK